MANTYSQISIHAVFAVKRRENVILPTWRDSLHGYIGGIIQKEAKLLAVGGWLDHVHIFFGMSPSQCVSDLLQLIKANSSKWINEQRLVTGKFQWQEGFGAFSYARSQRDNVIKYIMNQEAHHQKKTFKQEYLNMLRKFDVEYDIKYLFEYYD